MRILALALLWLGVAGFGLMTLCSGIFLPTATVIALPFGCVVGLLTWLCWRGIRRLTQSDQVPDEPAP
jgi:hypothetical protein